MKGLRDVYVIGIGQSKFSKQPQYTAIELGAIAAGAAIKDAGIDPRDLQVAYGARIEQQSQTAEDVLKRFGVQRIEMHNVENACCTGFSAVRQLWKDIAYGIYDIGIAIGTESLSNSPLAGGQVPTAKGAFLDLIGCTASTATGMQAHALMERRGATMEDLAYSAWKNHRHAVFNPYAHYRKEMSIEDIVNSEMITSPITKLMMCPMSDGAASVIMCTKEEALKYTTKLVKMDCAEVITGIYATYNDDPCLNPMLMELSSRCYNLAGYGPDDLSLVELHDAFSPEELSVYESMGFCAIGDTVKLLRERATEMGGRLPVNLSGGLLSLGHPLGASGCRVVVDITRQLRGEAAPEIQVKNPKCGLAQMIGGQLAGRNGAEVATIALLSV
ncbi:MAG: thiolase family protein [Oscillospiraceae bacterium]